MQNLKLCELNKKIKNISKKIQPKAIQSINQSTKQIKDNSNIFIQY